MKIRYYAKKVRVDLLTTLAFLRKRVSVTKTEDWDKLTRLLYYINGTKSQRMSFKKCESMVPEVSVDTSHGTYSDRKGYTGIIARLGESTIYASSTKQKFVTRSSCECKLVGLGNATQWIKWWRNFLIHQRIIKDDHCTFTETQALTYQKSRKDRSKNMYVALWPKTDTHTQASK
jgi:hypothetical protein